MDGIRLFLEAASAWLADKGFILMFTTILGSISAFFVYYITNKVIPKFTASIVTYIAKVISKLFGGEEEDVEDFIHELPIMQELKQWQENMAVQSELKLIELKNKLVSPYLSDAERIAYQGEYDYIFEKFKEHISQKTLTLLDEIEKAADDKFKL